MSSQRLRKFTSVSSRERPQKRLEADVIRKAFARTGVRSDLAISETTGFNYDRLHKRRLKPGWIGAMTISELRLLDRHAGFSDEELLEIVKGSKP